MRSTWRKAGQVGVRKLFLSREYLAWIWSRQTKHVKYFDSQSAWNKIRMANSLTPALPHFGFWRLVPSGLQCSLLRYHEWNEITKCGNSAWGVRIWEGFVFCLSRVLCHLPSYFSPCLSLFQVSSHVCLWVLISLSRCQVTWSGVWSWGNCTLSHGAFSPAACIFRVALFSFSLPVLCFVMDKLPARSFHTPGQHTNESHICCPQSNAAGCYWELLGPWWTFTLSPSPLFTLLPLRPAPSSLPRLVNSRQECVRYSVSGVWHLASQRCDSGNRETTQRHEDWLHEYSELKGRYHNNCVSTSL